MATVRTEELNVEELSIENETTQILEEQMDNLRKENLSLKQEIVSLKSRAIKVYEQNQMLEASPEVSMQMAKLKYDLALAENFVRSGALPVNNAQQAYVVIKAGEEVGMSPMESIQSIYIVNGQLSFYGKNLAGRLTKLGYKIDFTNETKDGVTVTISKNDFVESYEVKRNEQILQKSKAMTFAARNKMRFHGIRQIVNFHLAHLFSSIPIWDNDDIDSAKKRLLVDDSPVRIKEDQELEIIEKLKKIDSKDDLVEYFNLLDSAEKTKQVRDVFITQKTKLLKNG